MSHGSVAKSVRLRKESRPKLYCANARCLWRLSSGPCPKHTAPDPKWGPWRPTLRWFQHQRFINLGTDVVRVRFSEVANVLRNGSGVDGSKEVR